MKFQKKLSIKIITLFPNFVENFVEAFGIVKRAIKLKLLSVQAINLRSFGIGDRQVVDDRPYGGGVGMVLKPDILYKAIQSAIKYQVPKSKLQTNSKSKISKSKTRVILVCPQGKPFKQADAVRLAKYDQLVFVCGRYEGFDERIRNFVDEEISIGDYVLMGGELPALVISEAVMRLRKGILGKDESSVNESFSNLGLNHGRELNQYLEFPQYTKPEIWKVGNKKFSVPKVLLTGHHKNINEFRKLESEKRTKKRRPDLLIRPQAG
jgi:tRNA (guanine37-N1)-methyltransferase